MLIPLCALLPFGSSLFPSFSLMQCCHWTYTGIPCLLVLWCRWRCLSGFHHLVGYFTWSRLVRLPLMSTNFLLSSKLTNWPTVPSFACNSTFVVPSWELSQSVDPCQWNRDWRTHLSFFPKACILVRCYTPTFADDSKSDGCVGFGVVFPEITLCGCLPSYASIFTRVICCSPMQVARYAIFCDHCDPIGY